MTILIMTKEEARRIQKERYMQWEREVELRKAESAKKALKELALIRTINENEKKQIAIIEQKNREERRKRAEAHRKNRPFAMRKMAFRCWHKTRPFKDVSQIEGQLPYRKNEGLGNFASRYELNSFPIALPELILRGIFSEADDIYANICLEL